jgi:hypothetical protein
MTKRLLCITALLCMIAVPLRGSPPIGAAVQTWHYDAAKKILTLRIVNTTSQRDITAYTISVTTKYTDGTTDVSEMTDDFLPLMVSAGKSESLRQKHGNGTLAAGTSLDKNVVETKDVADVTAFLVLVAYADGKADVSEQRAFDHLIARRTGEILALQKANEVIKSSSDPALAAAELGRLADFARASGQTSGPNDPQSFVEQTLRRLSSEAKKGNLVELHQQTDAEIAARTPHSRLVKEGQ